MGVGGDQGGEHLRGLPGEAFQLDRVESNAVAPLGSDNLEALPVARQHLPARDESELVGDHELPFPLEHVVVTVGTSLFGLAISPLALMRDVGHIVTLPIVIL